MTKREVIEKLLNAVAREANTEFMMGTTGEHFTMTAVGDEILMKCANGKRYRIRVENDEEEESKKA